MMLDTGKVFMDRREAGHHLARMLESKYKNKNVLVLGIPRGGVIIASEIAKLLNGELSIVVTKKLPHPRQEELAIGAAAEDGSTYLTTLAMDIDSDTVRSIVESQLHEIRHRIQRFRKGKPMPEMFNRTVIIADDGIATGSTIVPAIKLCKSRKAARVIVAAPVSGRKYVSEVNELADDVVIAEQPYDFHAVGQVYKDFHHLSDREVIQCLDKFVGSKSRL